MKKMYVAPEVETIKVNAMNMLAASLDVNEEEVDPSVSGDQLGREDNPSRPNLWEQGW